jgi:DAK2 domain fusion protein YloV
VELKSMDAALLKRCFIAGAKNLEKNKEYINELNVFPVPDGDTGTNMTMTIISAAKAVSECPDDMEAVCKAISQGSLRGARGNSGVILSQLLRGFTKVVKDHEDIDAKILSESFGRAVETAYKAVMKPKEGTILTVAKGMSEKIKELCEDKDDILEILSETVEYGDEVLSRTPDMLPVLKEAGVVDSGGQGLMTAMKGALAALKSDDEAFSDFGADFETSASPSAESHGEPGERGRISTDDIKFGYCTEFLINLVKPMTEQETEGFKAFLESIGDSIVCVADDDIVKVHVHTNHPGQAFEEGLKFGSLSRMKVDNMREEHEERLIKDASRIAAEEKAEREREKEEEPATEACPEHKENGFVAVCAGEGLAEIFRGLGVDRVIEGGQTMNPSTEDILEAIEAVNADNVFILPNNKNIILAAEQAAKLAGSKNIKVIPTKTVPQGISALISFAEGLDADENASSMEEAAGCVKTGQITYAVRNTSALGKEIKEGDIMGIGDRGILAVGEILNITTLETVRAMADSSSELITVYRGSDVKEEDAEALCDSIREAFPECEVELQYGGQPVYYYIVSVE